MHNKPLGRRSLTKVREAIAAARQYAEQHKVPLTAERLAAELDMDLSVFRAIVEGRYQEEEKATPDNTAKISAIQSAFCEATASVMEHAMQRGSSPNMHMLYLKENAGYGDKTAEASAELSAVAPAPVIFLGEDQIQE